MSHHTYTNFATPNDGIATSAELNTAGYNNGRFGALTMLCVERQRNAVKPVAAPAVSLGGNQI